MRIIFSESKEPKHATALVTALELFQLIVVFKSDRSDLYGAGILKLLRELPDARIRLVKSPFHTVLLGGYRLKHKDSFGKSENLSKTFFTEILVFHPDYECKSSSTIGLL